MWTLICFVLFMLIVNKLLFKPMLAIIDERKAKIENAARKKADIEATQLAYENNLREAAENARRAESELADKMLADAEMKAENDIKQAEETSKQRLALAATDVEFETNEMGEKLGESVEELASAFISRLIS